VSSRHLGWCLDGRRYRVAVGPRARVRAPSPVRWSPTALATVAETRTEPAAPRTEEHPVLKDLKGIQVAYRLAAIRTDHQRLPSSVGGGYEPQLPGLRSAVLPDLDHRLGRFACGLEPHDPRREGFAAHAAFPEQVYWKLVVENPSEKPRREPRRSLDVDPDPAPKSSVGASLERSGRTVLVSHRQNPANSVGRPVKSFGFPANRSLFSIVPPWTLLNSAGLCPYSAGRVAPWTLPLCPPVQGRAERQRVAGHGGRVMKLPHRAEYSRGTRSCRFRHSRSARVFRPSASPGCRRSRSRGPLPSCRPGRWRDRDPAGRP
jgi:hypothetical protein